MRKRIESDLLLKILSVVFAFLLWMFVINTDNPVIKISFESGRRNAITRITVLFNGNITAA